MASCFALLPIQHPATLVLARRWSEHVRVLQCSLRYSQQTSNARHSFILIATPSGKLLETEDFPTTEASTNRAISWVARSAVTDTWLPWG